MSKPQSPPPAMAGYSVVKHLGGGGFADVYLYEQQALRRQVAVKVLRANISSAQVSSQFKAEATLMAALADHANIVTIHDAAIADDGRPFLVMAYYPGTLSQRYKSGTLAVPEVLSMGIELAGAVETIHRQDILHRDIKPANILTSKGGRPALTDFGISVSSLAAHVDSSFGMSIPWSPPEIIANDGTADHRADIYSLTATLYTLLAGRSPYESRSKSNDEPQLIDRIQRAPLPPTGRSDVPASLERILAKGLARPIGSRYLSALELARALQQVEREVTGRTTPVDVLDEDPVGAQSAVGTDDGHTRIRRLVTIEAQTARPGERTSLRGAAAPPVDATTARAPGATPAYLVASYLQPQTPADTQVRPDDLTQVNAPAPPQKAKLPLLIGAGLAVVLAIVLGVILLSGQGGSVTDADQPVQPQQSQQGEAAIDLNGVPSPGTPTAAASDVGVVFSWTNPDPQPGDSYLWKRTDRGGGADSHKATQPEVTVSGAPAPCIAVVLVRADGTSSDPAEGCTQEDGNG